MISVIDVGNTFTKAGFFEKDKLLKIITFPSSPVKLFYENLSSIELGFCIISSVKNLPKHVLAYLKAKSTKFIVLSAELKLPYTMAYETPQTLGTDRIALAAAALKYEKQKHILCIGAGSCITYTFVHQKQGLLGGGISPGIFMRTKAMNAFTDKLPIVKVENTEIELVGRNTEASLKSGIFWGVKAEIENMINFYEKQYGNLRVFLAGGDANIISQATEKEIFTSEHLALEGLHQILKLNVPKAD